MSGLEGLVHLAQARSRSISAENPTGAPGGGGRASSGTGARAARDLGVGWKVSPSIEVDPGETATLADVGGPGIIRHFWVTTHPIHWSSLLLRFHWDGEDEPAIQVPMGDFFCNGWGSFAQVSSLPVAANPYGGFNSYWPMPFRRSARVTLENLGDSRAEVFFQITYEEEDCLGPDLAYLHAQWTRSQPLARGSVHPILGEVRGRGHYVGTYLAWQSNSPGWWGEGEVKFYLDDDTDFPTICGTGTEDYMGGAWNFEVPGESYRTFTSPYSGLPQAIGDDGRHDGPQRFGMYRWHITDPIRFTSSIRVTVQALGWNPSGTYALLSDDITSTALFYLEAPEASGT